MNMKLRNIPFSPPDMTQAEVEEVKEAILSGWITTGPRTKELERQIAAYVGVNKAVCLNSQTACAEMALRLLGIGEGDEVIVPAYTYTATEDCTVVISYRADATHTAVIHDPESIDISQQIINKPHFVKREKNSVLIKSFYSGTEDIVVEIALAGGNGLPNPKNIFTVAKTSENMDSDITPSRYLLNRYTDWFSPHQVAAKENAMKSATEPII